jgi:hypothetical protein
MSAGPQIAGRASRAFLRLWREEQPPKNSAALMIQDMIMVHLKPAELT